jgi:hypothetical protein
MQEIDFYKGNPNLKAANVQIQFTKEQIEEYVKCSKDPLYFITKYMMIVHPDLGLVQFPIWDFQKKMIQLYSMNRFVITKCPRQIGKTTTMVGYLLWEVLFHSHMNIAVLANKGDTAREILGRLQLAYEHLPLWLQQGVEEWNKGKIVLENGSKILATSTSSNSVRGQTFNIVFLDEFAFVPNNVQEDFFQSVFPTISSGKTTKVIIVSTPNGMNLFYKLWKGAEDGKNSYAPFSIHWSQVPGRDAAWKKEQIANTSEQQFRQEHECEFLGSVNTLIDGSKLALCEVKDPIRRAGKLDIFEEPQANRAYAMTVDSSHGAGLDHSAFCIYDITDVPYKLVAKFYCNNTGPLVFPTHIYQAARLYNMAMILVEVNDIGSQIAHTLHYDMEYDHVLHVDVRGRAGQVLSGGFGAGKTQLGVKMSKKVKKIGCAILKSLIEEEKLVINDFDTVYELSSFISKGDSYSADDGMYDDLVMCNVMFSWMTTQPFFKELMNQDIRRIIAQKREAEIEESILPAGFFHNDADGIVRIDGDSSVWRPVENYYDIEL